MGLAREDDTLDRIRAAGAMAVKVAGEAPYARVAGWMTGDTAAATAAEGAEPWLLAPYPVPLETLVPQTQALAQADGVPRLPCSRRQRHSLAAWATRVVHLAPPDSREGEITDRLTRHWLHELARARGMTARRTLPGNRRVNRPLYRPRGQRRDPSTRMVHQLAPLYLAPLNIAAQRKGKDRARGSAGPLARRFVYISTTGVYGDRQGAWTFETTPLQPLTDRAWRRVDAERQVRFGTRVWRDSSTSSPATARPHRLHQPKISALVLRVPGIYAGERLPLERLREQVPVLTPEDDVITNHIHADDLARIARTALLKGPRQRVINAVDDTQMTLGDYMDAVADAFGLARAPRKPRAVLEQELTPMRMSFMRESRRLGNRRLKRELGVRLRWPTVEAFLKAKA